MKTKLSDMFNVGFIRPVAGLLIFWLFFALASSAQVYRLDTYCGGGPPDPITPENNMTRNFLTNKGLFWQIRILENFQTVVGSRLWEFDANGYIDTWRAPSTSPINIAGYNIVIPPNSATASAFWRNSYGGGDGARLLATESGYYYTFNIQANGYDHSFMAVLETAFDPKTITLTDAPSPSLGYRTATVTLSATPSANENVYIRYTTDYYVNSTIVPVNFTGNNIGTAIVPVPSTPGSTLKYYAYSSNRTKDQIEDEVVLYSSQVPHDMLTLEFSNTVSNTFNVEVTSSEGSILYPTMNNAFFAINNGLHTGAITIALLGNTTETATAELYASGTVPCSYTSIVIRPSGGAPRTISGDLAGVPILDFNGADNVTIDGRPGGTGSSTDLTISNTNVSATLGTSTIRFRGDATNDTITYCNVLGSATMAADVGGGNIWFGNESLLSGNDNNTVSYCNIGPAGSNLPSKGIYMSGTTTSTYLNNSGINIINNKIYDYFAASATSSGIYAGAGNTDCNFTGNRFYQTGTRSQSGLGRKHSAIWIENPSGNNFLISGNTIGHATPEGTGTYALINALSSTQFIPIYLNTGTTTATSVQGNTIAGISLSGTSNGADASAPFIGIDVPSGLVKIGDVTVNTIGSMSTTNSIVYTTSSVQLSHLVGIYGRTTSNWVTSNNHIGGIEASTTTTGSSCLVYGIRGNTSVSSATWTCTNNTIGGDVPNSIHNKSTGIASIVRGILNSRFLGIFTSDTIKNMTSAGGTGTGFSSSLVGMLLQTTTGNNTVSRNRIFNLSNSNPTAATVVTGLVFNGLAGINLVERNFIHSLNNVSSSTSASITGLSVVAGSCTFQNNIISLSASTLGALVYGFNESAGGHNFYFNTVSLTGNSSSGTQNAAFFSSGATTNIWNNIFSNTRTGSLNHWALNIVTTLASTTIDYNDYLGDTLVPSSYNTGKHSFTIDPIFINASSTADTAYKPVNDTIGITIPVVTNDYGGYKRCTPTIGAWEKYRDTVTTPVFILGPASIRCQGATPGTYTATASNSSGITYSLDAASQAAGNTIDPATGVVTYVAAWYGTTIITASAAGCPNAKTAMHTVTIRQSPACSITGQDPLCPLSAGNVYTAIAPTATAWAWAISVNGSIPGPKNASTVSVTSGAACNETFTLSVTITDSYGCQSTCPKTVLIEDLVKPTWTSAEWSLDITLQCSDGAGLATAQAMVPAASDNCPQTLVPIKTSGGFVAGACPQAGTYTNQFSVSDTCGNRVAADFTQVITIIDTQKPVWTSSPNGLNRTVECSDDTGLEEAQALVPVASDNCDASPTLTRIGHVFVASTCPKTGVWNNTWRVTDHCGNTVSTDYTQVITVQDTTRPIITYCPTSISTLADQEETFATISLATPVYSDNCTPTGSIVVSWEMTGATEGVGTNPIPASFKFNIGLTTVAYLFADACGNRSGCSFTVLVSHFTCPLPITHSTDFNLCSAALDPGFPTPATLIPAVTYTWAMTGATTGSASGAIGTHTFNLGVTTITWNVTVNGLPHHCTQTVTVEDNQAPSYTLPVLASGYCVLGFIAAEYHPGGTYPVNDLIPARRDYYIFTAGSPLLDLTNISDNCPGIITISWEIEFADASSGLSGTGQISTYIANIQFPLGNNKITWTLTDVHGNMVSDYILFIVLPRPDINE